MIQVICTILCLIAASAVHASALDPAASPVPPQAEVTIYTNANFHTLDPRDVRAEALAVAEGRILAIGSRDAVRQAVAGRQSITVDFGGRTVLPGLIDAHGHMASLGSFGIGVLDLSTARSWDDAAVRIATSARARDKGDWILGGRWDHESWPGRELPTHEQISFAAPDNPVWLRRIDGHAGIANVRALQIANITRETPDPPGGEIIRDDHGEPTGLLIDTAMELVSRHIPPEARGAGRDLILHAQELCLAAGLTSVHDMGISPADVAIYQDLEAEGRLKLRIYAMISGHHAMRYFDRNKPIIASAPQDRVTVRSTKLYMDGAMGSRGAWLLEPYADRPIGPDGDPYTGLAVSQPAFIEAVATHALAKGYQVCTHAIGDRANREVLDAYERAMGTGGAAAEGELQRDHRFRIEHAQLLSPADIPRFAELGIIASMQPTHCTSDMRWVEDRVGAERARGAYAWASLLRSGAMIAAGSDFPVESHNPFLGFHAAITRQTVDGLPAGGWLPQERMTRQEILRAMTLDAAYASFQDNDKGSLEVGKFADFIIIDRDVMTCDVADIPATRVLMTVIAGEVVYDSWEAGGK